MKLNRLFTALPIMAAVTGLTACTDSDYDLSDIDTTVQVGVNDLVIPINLSEVDLSDIIKTDNTDDDVIRIIDGEYVVLREGDFSSDEVKVNQTTINVDPVTPMSTTVYKYDGNGYLPPNFTIPAQTEHYQVTEDYSIFNCGTNNVPTEIRSVKAVETNWTLTVSVTINAGSVNFSKIAFHNMVLFLPKGLTGPMIAADGTVKVADFELDQNATSHAVEIAITSVDFDTFKTGAGSKFTFTPNAIGTPGSVDIEGRVGVKSGEIIVETLAGTVAPGSVTLVTTPSFSTIEITSFTGSLNYAFDNFNVSQVDITGLPDFLTGDDTSISLSNPQIYISVNNPVAPYGIDASSGLTVTPLRGTTEGTPATLNAGEKVEVGYDKGIAGPYNFCLSPTTPDPMYAPYIGSTHVGYSALSHILEGKGIPTALKVDFNDAKVQGDVTKFPVGRSIDKLKGNYTFYSPLALDPGSKIVYSDTEDGWNDDTVDKITITSLKVTTTVVNALPLDAQLSGYPIDKNGKQCVDPATGKPVTISPVTVKAGTSTKVELNTTGTVTHLDGIVFTATVISDKAQTLKPTGTLKLTDIRATANGYYTDEL